MSRLPISLEVVLTVVHQTSFRKTQGHPFPERLFAKTSSCSCCYSVKSSEKRARAAVLWSALARQRFEAACGLTQAKADGDRRPTVASSRHQRKRCPATALHTSAAPKVAR